MRGVLRFSVLTAVAMAVAAAQAFQISTLSHGQFSTTTMQDLETIDFYYYNGHSAIPVDTFFLDGNTNTGYISGPGNVDVMNFSFTVDNTQILGSQVNQELHWAYTTGTGQFANLTGIGSISIDFNYINQTTADTTAGLTGQLNPVPEPASLAALGLGAVALIRRRRRV